MYKYLILFIFLIVSGCVSHAPIALKEMGSFHVGGREVTISGKPVKEVVFTPGGVPAKVDPNGVYQVEQMYVQYFIPQNQRGALPLLMWHGGGLTGVTYETTPDGREGWLNYFVKKGWAVYNSDAVERGRCGLGDVSGRVQGRAGVPDQGKSVRALPHRRGAGLVQQGSRRR